MQQPAEIIAMEPPPPRRRRRRILAAAVVVVLAGAGVISYVLLRPESQATAVTTTPTSPAAATSPGDTLGRSACKSVFTPEVLAPDSEKAMTERDWQAWATKVDLIADMAAQSSNRDVARAGEDLQFEMKGDSFTPAFVQEAARRLRDACDRADYINIPGR